MARYSAESEGRLMHPDIDPGIDGLGRKRPTSKICLENLAATAGSSVSSLQNMEIIRVDQDSAVTEYVDQFNEQK